MVSAPMRRRATFGANINLLPTGSLDNVRLFRYPVREVVPQLGHAVAGLRDPDRGDVRDGRLRVREVPASRPNGDLLTILVSQMLPFQLRSCPLHRDRSAGLASCTGLPRHRGPPDRVVLHAPVHARFSDDCSLAGRYSECRLSGRSCCRTSGRLSRPSSSCSRSTTGTTCSGLLIVFGRWRNAGRRAGEMISQYKVSGDCSLRLDSGDPAGHRSSSGSASSSWPAPPSPNGSQ